MGRTKVEGVALSGRNLDVIVRAPCSLPFGRGHPVAATTFVYAITGFVTHITSSAAICVGLFANHQASESRDTESAYARHG